MTACQSPHRHWRNYSNDPLTSAETARRQRVSETSGSRSELRVLEGHQSRDETGAVG